MKYRIYLEQEYKDFAGDLEPDREIECEPNWLDYELTQYCKYLLMFVDNLKFMGYTDAEIK